MSNIIDTATRNQGFSFEGRLIPAVFLGFVFLLGGLLSPAHGLPYYINKDATGPSEDGASWNTAFRTITNATAKVVGGEFWVAKGLYPADSTAGIAVKANNVFYGGFTVGMTDVTQRDLLVDQTILDGNNAGRVLLSTGALTMDGFVLRNGTNSGAGGAFIPGVAGAIAFRNCLFTNNMGTSAGAVYINTSNLRHTFSNCTFVANRAVTGSGGAIAYNRGGGTGVFTRCVFIGNNAASGSDGGAISEAQTGNNFDFSNCVFTNNTSGSNGGAIRITGRLSLANCEFYNNSGGQYGGALYTVGPAALMNCDFSSNTASYSGGAIAHSGSTTNVYRNCSFLGNAAKGMGGTVGGGAIIEMGGYPETLISNCTFVGNGSSAPSAGNGVGGAIRAGPTATSTATVYVVNSIFWGNTATATASTNISMGTVSTLNLSYSDINTNAYHIAATLKNYGLGITNVDPQFASAILPYDVHLKSKGGRYDPATSTWVKDAVSSPCIDKGDPASDWSLEPTPNGGQINLGRYGGTLYASKTETTTTPKGALILVR